MAEKLFQVELILKCGRELMFLLEEPLVRKVEAACEQELSDRVKVIDQNGVTIIIDPVEVVFTISREFVPQDSAGKGMN